MALAGSHEHSHTHGHTHSGDEACTGHGGFQEADRHGEGTRQDRHGAGPELNVYAMWLHTLQVCLACMPHLLLFSAHSRANGSVAAENLRTVDGETSLFVPGR